MRVLVTGGAGLIGSHLVDELLRAGHGVVVLDNLDPEIHPRGKPAWVPAEVEFVHGDVRDPAAIVRSLRGCDAIAHLAAYGGFTPEISRIVDVNCTGTARLFEALRAVGGVAKIVTASSMAVYGEGLYRCAAHGSFRGAPRAIERLRGGRWEVPCPACGADAQPGPIGEACEPRPGSSYACSKYFQERLTLEQGRELGIAAVALRYFLTWGPRQSLHNPYSGICSIFAGRIVNGLPPVVYEDGRQTRDMVFVGDVARATRLALESPLADGKVFNVARGTGVEVGAFARELASALGRPIEPEVGRRFRPLDNRHVVGDASALRSLGFEPRVDVTHGLERYVEWLRGEGPVEERFGRAERGLIASGLVRPVGEADR